MLYERIADRVERLVRHDAQRYLCGHGRRYDRWVFAFTLQIIEENKKKGRGGDVLVGPDPRTLWIVSEGSRQRAESDAAD